MPRLLQALVVATTLAACAGTQFRWDDARKISAGMSTRDVTNLMGTPTAVKAQGDIVRYVWVDVNMMTGTTKTLTVDFKDGKAIKAPPIPDEFR
ncbi:MAG: outer membrane protein assembly factor BamE [Rhodocyclales bacterium]|nr:outer membrane protein assembly factor BamE [Rhodocyclales bacterium]